MNASFGYAAEVGDHCDREILYSTPDQFLIELLERGELLNLSRSDSLPATSMAALNSAPSRTMRPDRKNHSSRMITPARFRRWH